MFSKSTKYYHLPQWQNDDKPTWLTDMNTAFENIDTNLKAIEDMAKTGGDLEDRVVGLETQVAYIIAKIGTDVIDTIGISITNAIVNLKSLIDTATNNIINITNKIGTDVIDTIGSSITNAIVNLKNLIDALNIKIGYENIEIVGTSISSAILNLHTAITTATTNITNLTTTVTNITNKIGTDVIDTIGSSITNAIVNLNSIIRGLQNLIGNTPITPFGESITEAISNIYNANPSSNIRVYEDKLEQPQTFITNYFYCYNMGAIIIINFDITNNYNNVKKLLEFRSILQTDDVKEIKTKVFIEENNTTKIATVDISRDGIAFETIQNITLNSKISGQIIALINKNIY